MAYAVPPPMVFPASSAPAPTHLQAAELPPIHLYSLTPALLPSTAPHKHHLPRAGHADSCGPVRLTDTFLPRGQRRTGA
ncbi:hypothetical protein CRG98_014580 [Punica granatum]|uniref:Uncharacterized protein n=1 Tax=Punica granatum TaxID=22663 RepID=A0A2I0K917_PUNGR|nr:hypothetical protein CRG98_014580 [Punica granatum]